MTDLIRAEDVSGTYADYLLRVAKMDRANPANTMEVRLNAAVDAQEIVNAARERVTAFLRQQLAEYENELDSEDVQVLSHHGNVPSARGYITPLMLDDLLVLLHEKAQ